MKFIFEDPIDGRFTAEVEAKDEEDAYNIFAESSLDLAGSLQEAQIYARSFIIMEK